MSTYPMREATRQVVASVYFYNGRPYSSSVTATATFASGALKSFDIQSAIDDGNGIAVGSYVVPTCEVVLDKNHISSADWTTIKAASWISIAGGYNDGTDHLSNQGCFHIDSITVDTSTNEVTISGTPITDDMLDYTGSLINVYGTEWLYVLIRDNLTWYPSSFSYDDTGDILSTKLARDDGSSMDAKAYEGSAKEMLAGLYGARGANLIAGGQLQYVGSANFCVIGYYDNTASVSISQDLVYEDNLDIQDEVTLAGIMKDSGETYGSAPYLRTHGFLMDNGEFDYNPLSQLVALQYCPGTIKWRGDMTSPVYLGEIILVDGKRFIVCSKEQVFSEGGYYEILTSTAPVNTIEQASRDYGYNDVRAQGTSIVPTIKKVTLTQVNAADVAAWCRAYVKTLGSIKEVTLHIAVKLPSGYSSQSWVNLLSLDSDLTPSESDSHDVYFPLLCRTGGAKYPVLAAVWDGNVKAVLNGSYVTGEWYEGTVSYVVGM